MWIIPKTLSHFVPDTEGLNLDLEERAWMCAQSLMLRSKPSAAPTWERRLKKGGWITHLSGRILKPSLHESFVEKYTDSLEDIHANPSVQQASDKEKKTQDTYGHTSSSTSEQLDLFGAFGKMSKGTPRWGYGESCPIWKKKVIDARGAYSQRKKLALHTKGNESSSLLKGWKTPAARDYKDTPNDSNQSKKGFDRTESTLPRQVFTIGNLRPNTKNWATPQASDHIEGARTAKESNQKCLGRDLNQMNWATPNTMDYMETRSAEGVERIATGARKGRKRPSNLREQVDKKTCDIYKQQNWPTPRAGNPGSRKPGTGGKILAEEAKKNWRTPSVAEVQNQCNSTQIYLQNQVGATEKKGKNWDKHNGLPAPEKSSTSGKNQGSPKLNPNWVEQLMGLSTGWTDLGSWGMELSHKQQN